MNEGRERLKSELVAEVQLGRDAKRLLETQGKLLSKIKEGILKELALTSSVKHTTTKKFLWFTVREETRGGLEHIEALQADLRVILGYEALLESTQNDAEVAQMNLENLESRA